MSRLPSRLRLSQASPPDERRLKQWLAQLDDDSFEVREAATGQLTRLGKQAEPALRQVLARTPSAKVRRRVETILDELHRPFPQGEELAFIRVVEVLERIGSAEARRLLKRLAGGEPTADLTQQAQQAWHRLKRHPAAP